MDDDCAKIPIRTSSNVDDYGGCDIDTQLFDSESWSPKIHGGVSYVGDGNRPSQSTMPMNDTVVFEGAFETQVVDLSGDTQVMDFGCETQVVDFGGETQVLDDVDVFEHMGTQLLDCFESEKVCEINGVVSDDTEVLSDRDDLVRKDGGSIGDMDQDSKKGSMELLETPSNENNSGFHVSTTTTVLQDSLKPKLRSEPMRFTSYRTASLRASGLAARNTALKGVKAVASTIPTGNHLLDKSDDVNNAVLARDFGNSSEQGRDLETNNITVYGSSNVNACRGSNLAARKLCSDGEKEDFPYDSSRVGVGEDFTKFPACDLPGLSYVGSQEPGDLTQANALDFVDRFLKESIPEFQEEIDRGKSTGGKSKCLSSVKGAQKLAKKASEKSMAEELGIYDWDDSREDEGGGYILRRINKDLSGSRSLERKPLNARVNGLQHGSGRLYNSDSKLLSQNSKIANISVRESKRKFNRNLIDEMNAESGVDCQAKQLENDVTKADVPDMSNDARFDTQMAAEAMEALFFGEGTATCDANDACQDVKQESSSSKGKKQLSYRKRACPSDEGFAMMQTRKSKRIGAILNNTSPGSSQKRSGNVRKQSKIDGVTLKSQKAKENGCKDLEKMPFEDTRKRRGRPPKRGRTGLDGNDSTGTLGGDLSLDKQHKQDRVSGLGQEPISLRTRRSMTASDCRDEMSNLTGILAFNVKRNSSRGIRSSKMSTSSDAQSSKAETVKSDLNKEFEKVAARTNDKESDTLSCPTRRSIRNSLYQVDKSENIDDLPKSSVCPGVVQTSTRRKRSCRKTRSSVNHSLDDKSSLQRSGYAENVQSSARLDESPRGKLKPSNSSCTTPVNCKIPTTDISPVCMGDEYFKQSCEISNVKKSVLREIRKLSTTEPPPISPSKDLRKRREITDVRVLYSQHLDEDVIKHQKKILARLGVLMASSMEDATHFVADQFVRTRNMLEAIASGKPVVTHLWLESCGESNCFIDEKHYILRDAKKEKEFGFSMPTSLACASQRPLLQGLRVLITPNTKPGIEIISNLVRAVRGQAVERIGRSALKDGSFPDDLLVLSCEEDYAICVPFLERGATIYSSELLLNGIVTQKLEYDRYRLFVDYVRKTRSTIWLKKDGNNFLPVAKNSRH